ncbi:MAG: aminotransferase class I/II-fold pyridoxal phosphate-dependent enzyme [Anaerolineaceae bacterium]|nr:aminotransferase class I/II-fold pyridoxal phosphate-dependent enzyme [Anaerolineaceae bacterium]
MDKKYLSNRTLELKPSGIRKFFDIAATMKDVISLGVGEPDFTTPAPILEAGIDSLMQGDTHYTSNAGLSELREALAKKLNTLYGTSYNPDTEIVMTVGGSEALYLAATALLNPGDEVIIPTPCFVSYQAEVAMVGAIPVEVPSKIENNFQFDPKEIEAAITPKTKAVLIGYPSNPTGAVATKEALLELAKLAEKHDLIVLSDEIYDRLVYGQEHVCFAALPGMWERTVFLGGFSKDYAMTGWRIGFAAAPAGILQGMLLVHQYTIMSAPTMAQRAAIEALLTGDTYVDQMVQEYDRRRKLMVGRLNEMGLPTFEPRGAFYAFPKVDVTGLTSDEFATRLLEEEAVAVVPGEAFGAGGDGFVRCCYATAYEKIEEAMDRMERFIKRL